MAYQNVGKPRIFIDYFQYCQAIGNIGAWMNYHPASPVNNFLNPLRPFVMSSFTWWSNGDLFGMYDFVMRNPVWGMNYSGFLGHNFGGIPVSPVALWYEHQWDAYDAGTQNSPRVSGVGGGQTYHHWEDGANNPVNIVNAASSGLDGKHVMPPYNGFSLWSHDELDKLTVMGGGGNADDDNIYVSSYRFHINETEFTTAGLDSAFTGTIGGTFTSGRIFDFEHAPDIKVSMERTFDGVKKQKTIGGVDISNTTYTGPPNWTLSGTPWALTESSPGAAAQPFAVKRMGRRTWKLKFSMMSDRLEGGGGLMSANELPTPFEPDVTDDGYLSSDINENLFVSDMWTDDSFMGLVFQKTLGFTLPFIFQPDSNNNSPDQFAICKIDNKSLRIKQSSFKKYDISLTIREVW